MFLLLVQVQGTLTPAVYWQQRHYATGIRIIIVYQHEDASELVGLGATSCAVPEFSAGAGGGEVC